MKVLWFHANRKWLLIRLDLNKLTPTEISLQMADKSTAIPIGICEDVPVVVANVTILTDLVVSLRRSWS